MLNQSSEYALRAVALIASRDRDVPSHAKELAAALGVPANYLSKILHQLASAGVLVSRRGRQGGFLLAGPAARMRLARVVAPFEDLTQYRACLLGRPTCSARGACAAHHEWKPIASAVLRFLQQTSVAQLARY
jgi:Rrf2 family protein